MHKTLNLTAFIAAFSIITILAMVYGFETVSPYNVLTTYGLPFTWATHTTNTFTAHADVWNVDVAALALVLILWLGALTVLYALIQIVLNSKK